MSSFRTLKARFERPGKWASLLAGLVLLLTLLALLPGVFSATAVTTDEMREDLAEKKRFHEAVGLLDRARYESNAIWWEACDLIIEFKQRGGLPLSVSEKKAVLRAEQGETCQGMPEETRSPA